MQVFPKLGKGVMCLSLGTFHQRKDRGPEQFLGPEDHEAQLSSFGVPGLP